jgi:hypothetical protein
MGFGAQGVGKGGRNMLLGGMGSEDPRTSRFNQSATRGLNRWIAENPLKAPIIGFVITAVFLLVFSFAGKRASLLIMFALLVGIISTVLLIIGVIRKIIESSQAKPLVEQFMEEDMLVDGQTQRNAMRKMKERPK